MNDKQLAIREFDGPSYNQLDAYVNPATFAQMWRVATMFAQSTVVPEAFKGNPANCFIALQFAFRSGLDPMLAFQKLYIVGGRLGMETQLAVAMVRQANCIVGPIRSKIEGLGKNKKCTVTVTDARTDEDVSHTLDWATVELEGWLNRRGSKWATDPDLMLYYRATMRLLRQQYPDTLLGMYTKDELEEMATVEGKVNEPTGRMRPLPDLEAPAIPQPEELTTGVVNPPAVDGPTPEELEELRQQEIKLRE